MKVSSPKSRLVSFWDESVFAVGETDYQWIDVALAAMVRGDWPAFERRLDEGLAAAAQAGREGTQPSPDDLDHPAREAMLCITIDRLSLHDVAALSRRAGERRIWFVDDLHRRATAQSTPIQ